MAQQNTNTRTNTGTRLTPPRRYLVRIHNDDVTTMEFVVEILQDIFNMTLEHATATMLEIHHNDYAVVGTYSYDIAQTKAEMTIRQARENGFPLRVTVEPTIYQI